MLSRFTTLERIESRRRLVLPMEPMYVRLQDGGPIYELRRRVEYGVPERVAVSNYRPVVHYEAISEHERPREVQAGEFEVLCWRVA